MTDTDGNELDRYLLRYSIYVNEKLHTFDNSNSPLYYESIDEMPATESRPIYSFDTEYMFGWNPGDLYALIIKTDEPVESLGVKLIYNVLGDERQSEIAQIDVRGSSVSQIASESKIPLEFYSLDGTRLEHPRGACIIRYSDGSVKKVLSSNN